MEEKSFFFKLSCVVYWGNKHINIIKTNNLYFHCFLVSFNEHTKDRDWFECLITIQNDI